MKPENAVRAVIACDLSIAAFEDALARIGCFPMCTLRVSKYNVEVAQQMLRIMLPTLDEVLTCPRVHIVIDNSYDSCEWSVEYQDKIWWSPGV